MLLLFRVVRLLAAAVWLGGLVFFGFVAAAAFKVLPTTHQAGDVVRTCLISLHHVGMVAGLIYLIFTVALLATQRDTHPARAIELVLVLAMLGFTVFSQFSIMPRMENDRLSLGGDVMVAPLSNPIREHFERLHTLSVRTEGIVLFAGIFLIAMAAIHGHDDTYLS